MNNLITYSSELMKNYVQASIMDPEDTFEVLQYGKGLAILFSIGTDGVFYATKETENSKSGWERIDLSTAVLTGNFAGGKCTKMNIAQNVSDSTIGVAMVISVNGTDYLFLCMGNSGTDVSWLNAPQWKYYPFDAGPVPSPLRIANVFISETEQGQFISVDRDKDKIVDRYYIATGGGQAWNFNPLPIDLNINDYKSRIGRASIGGNVDGMYTCGAINGNGQLIYCPLYNDFGSGPASPSTLYLPGRLVPQSIATYRNGLGAQSDLLVTAVDQNGNGGLYFFASKNQKPFAVGELLLQHELLINVSYLQANLVDGTLTVWGLNGADQIFYISCQYSIGHPGAWTIPLPILTKVDKISPFINLSNNGNTIFAVGQNLLSILSKSPETGLWSTKRITLPAPAPGSPALSFSTYTTRIQVLDENNNPVKNLPLRLSSNTRNSFYINNLYYILDTTPVPVETDSFGSITIIETVDDLSGTVIKVQDGSSQTVVINPMDTPFEKIARLNTSTALQGAIITHQDGSKSPLVSPGTSTSDLETVAKANEGLAKAYSNIKAKTYLTAYRPLELFNAPVIAGFEGAMVVDLGDIFSWLESAADFVVHIVEDAASGIWSFVVNIGGKLFQGILNSIEKVVGAVIWVFKQIIEEIEKLIEFLEFLFEWQDILTTHNVLKNIFIRYTEYSISNLGTLKKTIATDFNIIKNVIDTWAGITAISETPDQFSASNPAPDSARSAPSNFGIHHFQGNLNAAQATLSLSSVSVDVFDELIKLISAEETNLENAINEIQTQIVDQFGSLSGDVILKRFLAIVTDLLLGATESILGAIIDILIELSSDVVDSMTATIDFPVLSWLYKELTGNQLSILDLMCLISAIPVTIVFKIAEQKSPYPTGSTLTQKLLNASSFAEIQAAYFSPHFKSSSTEKKENNIGSGFEKEETSSIDQDGLKTAILVGGIVAFLGTQVMIVGAISQDAENPSKPIAVAVAVGNCLYVMPSIVGGFSTPSRWDVVLNDVLTGISILKGFTLDVVKVGTKVSSFAECLLNIAWFAPVIGNVTFSTGSDYYPALIPDTIGNSAFNIGGILAPFTENPYAQGAQFICMESYGVCMIVSGKMKS